MTCHAVPILPAVSITKTRAFYEKAGFRVLYCQDSQQGYLIVEREGIELQFFLHSALDPLANDHGAYVRCDSVERALEMFTPLELPAHGVPRLDQPENKPWGMREAYIVDLNGNLLRFGQPVG